MLQSMLTSSKSTHRVHTVPGINRLLADVAHRDGTLWVDGLELQ